MDAAWVDKIKTDKLQEDFFDPTMDRGISLVLRVSRSGSKIWQVIYRPKGEDKRKRFKIGTYPPMSLAEARGKAYEILGGLKEGVDPSEEKRREKDAPTFGDLAEEYIERWAKAINPATGEHRKRSWKKDQDAIDRDLNDWKNRRAKDIKKRDVIEVLDLIVERGSTIQANRTLALIRKIFNWGISRDVVEANPCAQLKAPSPETSSERVLSDDEIRAFWKACDKMNHIIAAAFRMRLVTGQRGGEVDSMSWADIEGEWWTIPPARAKNKTGHRVPLTKPALAILDEMKILNEARDKASAWVFPSRMKEDGHLSDPHASARKMLEKVEEILQEQGGTFAPFKLHDLRRTVSTNLGELGVDEALISRVLNHKDPGGGAKVTRIYNRYKYDKEKRQALEMWAERLEEILKADPTGKESTPP